MLFLFSFLEKHSHIFPTARRTAKQWVTVKNAKKQKSKKAKKYDAKKENFRHGIVQKSKKAKSFSLSFSKQRKRTPTTAIYYYQKYTYRRSWIS
jgi:acyl-homoserine lactone acylase PvdQ